MQKYRCHKEVWATKIAAIEQEKTPQFSGALCRGSKALGTACGHCERCKWYEKRGNERLKMFIIAEDANTPPIEVDEDFMRKHEPFIGGYYVVYKDGYKSFSPAEVFEDGYAPIS